MRVVALLDTMWGHEVKQAPRCFRINPLNNSGRRLYHLVGQGTDLWVTNSCPKTYTKATDHGIPDPEWVYKNLNLLMPFGVLLVCGTVAQETFLRCRFGTDFKGRIVTMKHPAARNWTKMEIDHLSTYIQGLIKEANNANL